MTREQLWKQQRQVAEQQSCVNPALSGIKLQHSKCGDHSKATYCFSQL